jgi:hypothetical protein
MPHLVKNHFVKKPSLAFDVMDEKNQSKFYFDYIDGTFKKRLFQYYRIKIWLYEYWFSPSFQLKMTFLVNLWSNFFYSLANEGGKQ